MSVKINCFQFTPSLISMLLFIIYCNFDFRLCFKKPLNLMLLQFVQICPASRSTCIVTPDARTTLSASYSTVLNICVCVSVCEQINARNCVCVADNNGRIIKNNTHVFFFFLQNYNILFLAVTDPHDQHKIWTRCNGR